MSKNEQGCVQAVILMELCSGGSLFDMMAKNPNARLKESQVITIALVMSSNISVKEVAQGIKAMHSLSPPMAHRDIKIENILFSEGHYKLCDFGSSSRQRIDFR
jgi:serine/threonine protein kinase